MWRRLQYWLNHASRNDSLREEMELHLLEKAAQLEADGMSHEQAQAEARRRFGNVALRHEESREIWMTRFWFEFVQDARYALRSMAGNKVFSALAVCSLALGIGANTAIYSLMEAVLFRSLPVQDPESLVLLNWHSPPPMNSNKEWVHVMHSIQGRFWPGEKGVMFSGIFPYAAFETLGQDHSVFSTLFGYYDGHKRNVAIRGQAISARAQFVSGGYFRGLGVSPIAGRMIGIEDDRAGAEPVAVISFSTSQSRFGSPASAVGQTMVVDKVSFTVIGVAPPEFFGVDPAVLPEIYLPLHATLLVDGADAARAYTDSNSYWLEMMGRLRPGVSMAEAQAALAPRFHQWVAGTATTEGERAKLPQLALNPGAAGLGSLRREYSKPIFVLFGMVGLILAITCANIANLLLAKASVRRREMAVRLSLGAGRGRLIRQLLTESVLLAILGGAFGVAFAMWGVRALTLLLARGQENFTLHAELNWSVLLVTAALSALCGVLFGLVPALQSTRPDVVTALKHGQTGRARGRIQQTLSIAQISMSFLLLVAAGLFVGSLNNLQSVALGYARENILLFTLNASQAGHQDQRLAAFYENLRKRVEEVPGVASATYSHASIVNAGHAGKSIRGAMKVGSVNLDGASVMVAGPRFLNTMQIPLLTGREIEERDQPGSPPVAVISERLAQTYFKNENPLGRRIRLVEERRDVEIVGVSANLRYGGLKQDGSSMTVFVSASQFPPGTATYAVRTNGDPLSHVQSMQEVVRAADPSIPLTNVVTQAAEIDRTISREITFANLCTGFALLALLTACVGLYGSMSYQVSRQVSEIGIRMALGAQRSTVVWMVLRRVLLMIAAGLAISVPIAFAGTRFVKSLLFGIQPMDARTLALAAATLVLAALAAGYAPARRASRISPMIALRQE